jgi:hypothetical protein
VDHPSVLGDFPEPSEDEKRGEVITAARGVSLWQLGGDERVTTDAGVTAAECPDAHSSYIQPDHLGVVGEAIINAQPGHESTHRTWL